MAQISQADSSLPRGSLMSVLDDCFSKTDGKLYFFLALLPLRGMRVHPKYVSHRPNPPAAHLTCFLLENLMEPQGQWVQGGSCWGHRGDATQAGAELQRCLSRDYGFLRFLFSLLKHLGLMTEDNFPHTDGDCGTIFFFCCCGEKKYSNESLFLAWTYSSWGICVHQKTSAVTGQTFLESVEEVFSS